MENQITKGDFKMRVFLWKWCNVCQFKNLMESKDGKNKKIKWDDQQYNWIIKFVIISQKTKKKSSEMDSDLGK